MKLSVVLVDLAGLCLCYLVSSSAAATEISVDVRKQRRALRDLVSLECRNDLQTYQDSDAMKKADDLVDVNMAEACTPPEEEGQVWKCKFDFGKMGGGYETTFTSVCTQLGGEVTKDSMEVVCRGGHDGSHLELEITDNLECLPPSCQSEHVEGLAHSFVADAIEDGFSESGMTCQSTVHDIRQEHHDGTNVESIATMHRGNHRGEDKDNKKNENENNNHDIENNNYNNQGGDNNNLSSDKSNMPGGGNNNNDKSKAGAVVWGVFLMAAVLVGVLWVRRRKNKRNRFFAFGALNEKKTDAENASIV